MKSYKNILANHTHYWSLTPKDALSLQKKLAGNVIRKNRLSKVNTIAGIDVGIKKDMSRAAIVLLNFPQLDVVEQATSTQKIQFPYIPGLLSFREGPVILKTFLKLSVRPDLLIFDGQGIAHPRRLGIASHIGILVDIPSIGCAKSRLCGYYREPDPDRGSYTPLIDNNQTIGAVVRTRTGIKPVFVSIGHRINLNTCIDYILACCPNYRLPETTRHAHKLASYEKNQRLNKSG